MSIEVKLAFDVLAFDQALGEYDLLMMPTTPIKATELPSADAPRELYVERALNMTSNTAPFDITDHPAMAVPCGMSDGLLVSCTSPNQAPVPVGERSLSRIPSGL